LSLIEILRRKEFYVVLVLVLVLGIWMTSMELGGNGAGRFAKDIVMQVIWLASFGLAAPLAARQIASDLEHKSIYVIMSRRINRWEYVLGRTAGAAVSAVVCFASMFAVLLAVVSFKGASQVTDPSLWQAFALQVTALVMLSAVAVFFSTFSTPSGAVTFSIIVLVVMRYGGSAILHKIEGLSGVGRGIAYSSYLVLPHFEFFNMSQRVVHGWGALPALAFSGIVAYGIVYALAAAMLGAMVFKKRRL
jgi:ABC-type transport system involved in multi-copper enzyme maturation permease subunit